MDPNQPEEPSGQSGPQPGGRPTGSGGPAGPRPPVWPQGMAPPPPPPFPPPYYMMPPAQPPQRGRWGRIFGWSFTGILFSALFVSLMVNVYLGLFLSQVTRGPHESSYHVGMGGGRIVILPIEGMIDDSKAEFIRQATEQLRGNLPRAVVLRVNSGGGGVGASDRILDTLERFQSETGVPVVASFGTVAASGGYYVSASADWIVSEPTTITGSIGVMSVAFTLDELVEDIGVRPEIQVAEKSPRKDIANNIFRPWTDEDRRVHQQMLNHAYDQFVDVIFKGRGEHFTARTQVESLADGSLYNTAQAVENKLVDEEGYMREAIAKAASLAGMGADPTVVIMREPMPLGLLGMLGMSGRSSLPDADALRRIAGELARPRLEY